MSITHSLKCTKIIFKKKPDITIRLIYLTVALDCLVGDWTDWSERNEDGKITRTRNVMRNAINGGAMCSNLEQTQLGNLYVLLFFNV